MQPTKWLLPYDLYERHQVVARLIAMRHHNTARVLDVGGRCGLLAGFTFCWVWSVNIDGKGDVLADGQRLPFASASFDIVTAIDTLEHLPRHRRLDFVSECWRVSARDVIIAAPYDSPGHAEVECRLNALCLRITGQPHPYLSEHIQNGLPGQSDIQAMIERTRPASWRLCFAGDYRREAAHFAAAIQTQTKHSLLARVSGLLTYLHSRALFNRLSLTEHPTPHANRFYLLLSKS